MSGFTSVAPNGPLYRVARTPDAWTWPDWAYAGPDGTFGNRWDDPAGSYRVLYASSTRLGAFVETLAPFRVDLAVIAGLQEIDAPEEPVASSVLPRRWLAGRVIGEASLDGSFVDIGDADTLATIRAELAARAIHYGLSDVDAAAIRLHAPRRFTQEISRFVYERHEQDGSCAGIRYRSRFGDQFVNWAIFEPPSQAELSRATSMSAEITPDAPDLLRALELFGLKLS